MVSSATQDSLGTIGRRTSSLFQILVSEMGRSNDQSVVGEGPAVENESQRFSLWAINLGLHHTGHSSLDYRLSDADILSNAVRKLLRDLNETLEECTVEPRAHIYCI